MNGYEMMERIIEIMGKEFVCDELMVALSDDELKEGAEWIARMNNIDEII